MMAKEEQGKSVYDMGRRRPSGVDERHSDTHIPAASQRGDAVLDRGELADEGLCSGRVDAHLFFGGRLAHGFTLDVPGCVQRRRRCPVGRRCQRASAENRRVKLKVELGKAPVATGRAGLRFRRGEPGRSSSTVAQSLQEGSPGSCASVFSLDLLWPPLTIPVAQRRHHAPFHRRTTTGTWL